MLARKLIVAILTFVFVAAPIYGQDAPSLGDVGQNGAVEQIIVSKMSRMSSCMVAKVGSGVFPAPPKPDYWVKISLQIQR